MYVKKRIPIEIPEKSPIAKSNPEMIKSARINRGITEEDIERFYNNWKSWENGETSTTWEDLRLIAKFYGKPSFYYFLENPIENEYLKDYTIKELFEEFQEDFEEFKKELDERLKLCEHIELNDL